MREKDHLEESGENGSLILKCVFTKWDGEWTGLICLRLGTGGGVPLNAVMNLLVPSNAGKFLTSLERVRFSRRTLFHGVS